jgi:hypothetical protein
MLHASEPPPLSKNLTSVLTVCVGGAGATRAKACAGASAAASAAASTSCDVPTPVATDERLRYDSNADQADDYQA